jgi:predicted DCC family thiol-disulfide oxidoreductase YuxK
MVILFDGVCNLCNNFIKFILKKDKKKIFRFASLQSKYGIDLSRHFNLPTSQQNTVILYDGQKIFTESDAVLKIASSLSGIWKSTILLLIIPCFIRNWFYRIVARNRYKLFGKKDQCTLPTEEIKDRFLDDEVFKQPEKAYYS